MWLSTEVGMMMGEGNKLCIRAEPLAKGRFLTTAGKHRREAAVNIWERGKRRGKLRGGGGCQDNRSRAGGRARAWHPSVPSKRPSFPFRQQSPLAAIAADHRLSLITASSPGPVGKQQARHGRKGGHEKRPAARRTTAPRNTHKHLIRTSDGDRRCAKAAAACRQAQVEWSWQGGKMRGGGGCQDNRARQEREVRSALA